MSSCQEHDKLFLNRSNVQFLLIGAHPGQSPHHRLGEPIRGKGLLQIWAINLMPGKSSSGNENNGDFSPRDRLKGRGRGGKWGRGQEITPASDDFSDDESAVDTYTTLTGFNLTKGGREKARGRGRGRGRGRPPLKFSGPETEGYDAENVGPHDNSAPGSPPETLNAWIKGRANIKHAPSSHKPPIAKALGALPKMVLGIAHEGEVTWDAKWRPVADKDSDSESIEGLDEREGMRLGFLAVILGDGSIQV